MGGLHRSAAVWDRPCLLARPSPELGPLCPPCGCAVHDGQEPCFLYGSACWGRGHSQGEQSREQGSAVTDGPEGHTRRTCAIVAARHGGRPRWPDSVLGLSRRSVVRLCPWAVMGGSAPAMLTRPPCLLVVWKGWDRARHPGPSWASWWGAVSAEVRMLGAGFLALQEKIPGKTRRSSEQPLAAGLQHDLRCQEQGNRGSPQ